MDRIRHSSGLVTVLGLLLAVYVFAKFQGGFVSWFIFYSYLPASVVALLLYFFGLKGVYVERSLAERRCVAGQTFSVTLVVHNPYRLPLVYLALRDHLPPQLEGKANPRQQVVFPWFRRTCSVTYQLEQLPRGVYHWDRVELVTGDWFGLIRTEKRVEAAQRLTVYPRYDRLREWPLPPLATGLRTGSAPLSESPPGEGSIVGVREYVSGDRLAQVHWKASATHGRLLTKETEHPRGRKVLLILNQEKKAYSGREEMFEAAVSLTASLADYALRHHYACSLIIPGVEEESAHHGRSDELLDQLLERLARLSVEHRLPFLPAVRRLVRRPPWGATLVIISPVLNQESVALLAAWWQRRIAVQFFWVKGRMSETVSEQNALSLLRREKIPVFIYPASAPQNSVGLRSEHHGAILF